MASITERAQRMEKDLRETTAKHDRAAAELQVSLEDLRACGARVWCVRVVRACGARVWCARMMRAWGNMLGWRRAISVYNRLLRLQL